MYGSCKERRLVHFIDFQRICTGLMQNQLWYNQKKHLDARDMAENKDKIRFIGDLEPGAYMTLKEAAEVTSYSPDYIGQLIRAGKLEGQQVYHSVSWVTTERALRTYMETRGKEVTIDPNRLKAKRVDSYMRYTLYAVIGI